MRCRRASWRAAVMLLLALLGACGERSRPVVLVFDPAHLELRADAGQAEPVAARIHVQASSAVALDVTTTAPWLRPQSGRPTAPGDLVLWANAAGLAAGTHSAQVLVRVAGRDAMTLPVVLTVGSTGGADGSAPPSPSSDAAPGPTDAVPAGAEAWPPPDAKIERDALARVIAATVLIEATYRPQGPSPDAFPEGQRRVAWGSGFVAHPEGLVLTNAHVVDPVLRTDGEGETPARRAASATTHVLERVTVRLASGTRETRVHDAEVLCRRPYPLDLALLRIVPDGGLQAIRELQPAMRGGANFSVGETHRVWAVGFPLGKEMETELERFRMSRNPNGPDPSVREGVVTALRRDEGHTVKAVEHSCNIEPGNSGGPLVNFAGQLVGVNSLGGGRSAFAIPIDRVLDTFYDVLACHGYGSLLQQMPHRTVRVVPGEETDASAPDLIVVGSLAEALSTARLGDVIELAEGEYPLTESLTIPAGARVRGAGVGRTVLRAVGAEGHGFGGYAVHVGGPRYFELHDLTIVNEGGNGLWVLESSHPDTYLHDLEVRARTWALGIGKQAGADVHGCRLHGGVVLLGPGSGTGPRFTSDLVRVPDDSPTVQAAVDLREEAAATFEGCRLASTRDAVSLQRGARATLRGTELGTSGFGGRTSDAAVSVWAGEADLADCLVWTDGNPALHVDAGARATVAGCRFVGGWSPAVEVCGEGSRATLTRSVFEGRGAGLLVREGAEARLQACAVLTDRDRDLEPYRWADAPRTLEPVTAPIAASLPLTPEERRQVEETARRQRAERPFGVVVHGATGPVEIEGTLFLSATGGTAIRLEAGAAFVDRGGNEVVGASQAVLHTDETHYPR